MNSTRSKPGGNPLAKAHATAVDVTVALATGVPANLGNTPLADLPEFARLAAARLHGEPNMRHGDQLDGLLEAYAFAHAALVDLNTCAAVHRWAAQQFPDFFATVRLPQVKP